jgi:hypothetical protein
MIVSDDGTPKVTEVNKLMTFAEFEDFVAESEWISNDDFESEGYPDHPWFCVKLRKSFTILTRLPPKS